MGLKERTETFGIDYHAVVTERFMGREELYLKFLKRFPDDICFAELADAVDSLPRDYWALEKSAHILRGVALNLGFQKLGDLSDDIVQSCREEVFDRLEEQFERVETEYRRVIHFIQTLE